MPRKQELPESFDDYRKIAATRMERSKFGEDVRARVARRSKDMTLTEAQLDNLFDITDDFLRNDNALHDLVRLKVPSDWKFRRRLIETTETTLGKLRKDLTKCAKVAKRPLTAELATDLLRRLSNFEARLRPTFERIDLIQRSHSSMMRMLSLKNFRRDYIGELAHYLADEFPSLKAKNRDIVIAATMEAANLFTSREKRDDVVSRIPMAVSSAKKRERKLREDGVELTRRQKSA